MSPPLFASRLQGILSRRTSVDPSKRQKSWSTSKDPERPKTTTARDSLDRHLFEKTALFPITAEKRRLGKSGRLGPHRAVGFPSSKHPEEPTKPQPIASMGMGCAKVMGRLDAICRRFSMLIRHCQCRGTGRYRVEVEKCPPLAHAKAKQSIPL